MKTPDLWDRLTAKSAAEWTPEDWAAYREWLRAGLPCPRRVPPKVKAVGVEVGE